MLLSILLFVMGAVYIYLSLMAAVIVKIQALFIVFFCFAVFTFIYMLFYWHLIVKQDSKKNRRISLVASFYVLTIILLVIGFLIAWGYLSGFIAIAEPGYGKFIENIEIP